MQNENLVESVTEIPMIPECEPVPVTTVYLGPNIPGGLLFHGAVFVGRLPNYILALMERYPLIQNLFLNTEQVAHFKERMGVLGTEENRMFQSALLVETEESDV